MKRFFKQLFCLHLNWYYYPLDYETAGYFGQIELTCNDCLKKKIFNKNEIPINYVRKKYNNTNKLV